MKELSIEQKAKAYDEALSVAQETYTTQPMYREWLTKMFPELKESEDERIRKEIITYLSTAEDKELIPYESWVNWLEKQGKQKHVWSEENDYVIERLFCLLDNEQDKYSQLSSDFQEIEEIKNKLKSLKDRVQPQPKQEWSEEDKIKLKHILRLLDVKDDKKYLLMFGLNSLQDLKKDIAWLKSLRPQNTWKPSDEQLKALDIAIRCGIQLGTWEEEALKSLKEQLFKLKKLGEE